MWKFFVSKPALSIWAAVIVAAGILLAGTLRVKSSESAECACLGAGCHCLYGRLCDGTESCGCQGVDCSCTLELGPRCKFAGIYYHCTGSHPCEDDNVQHCDRTCKCGHGASGDGKPCSCSWGCQGPCKRGGAIQEPFVGSWTITSGVSAGSIWTVDAGGSITASGYPTPGTWRSTGANSAEAVFKYETLQSAFTTTYQITISDGQGQVTFSTNVTRGTLRPYPDSGSFTIRKR
jgi:hypothetical protein